MVIDMEVHRQTCQSCGSRLLRNHLVRKSGSRSRVIVQCGKCMEFVAQYVLGQGGYYHHGKGFESFVRGQASAGELMSGKYLQQEFETIQEDSMELFENVVKFLKNQNKL